jgi:hypothetical protein
MTTKIEILIPEVVPSLNRLLRLHWAARRSLLNRWEWMVFAELHRQRLLNVLPEGRVAVEITRCGKRQLDPDNLHGAAKIVLDAMKRCGLIADDSSAHIALTCSQETGRRAMTRIRVSPINELSQATGSSHEPPVSLSC